MIRSIDKPKKAKVTLRDIAEATGYTINTISHALNDKADISEATRKMIKDKACELGYIPNILAGSLRSGITKTIAIILGDISNPYFGIMVKEIESTAEKQKYNIFVINTDERKQMEDSAVYSALSKNVDGIILFPVQRSKNSIKLLQKSGVPFILVGRHFEDMETDYVISDDVNGGYLATKHLIDKGHEKILMINGAGCISCARQRIAGYKKALMENNIEIRQNLIREIPFAPGSCKALIDSLIYDKVDFTSIFAFNDMLAWEAIYAFGLHNIEVPADVAVVGYDNIQSKLFFPFPLTTINISKGKMAARAVEILLQKIDGINTDKHYNLVFDTNLVVRSST